MPIGAHAQARATRSNQRRAATSFRRLNEDEVKSIAAKAVQEASGDPDRFDAIASREILKLVPGFSRARVIAASVPGLTITVAGPANLFLDDTREFIRKMEPIGHITWHPYILVAITPTTMEAPNIERIVIMRDGAIVTPLETFLSPARVAIPTGMRIQVNRGAVTYSPPAFNPDKPVKLTAIPTVGHNIVVTFSQAQLRQIQ
jgi:hypothetical protein